jgi:hypothetical protein
LYSACLREHLTDDICSRADPFDRNNLGAMQFARKDEAGVDWSTIQKDDAGPDQVHNLRAAQSNLIPR